MGGLIGLLVVFGVVGWVWRRRRLRMQRSQAISTPVTDVETEDNLNLNTGSLRPDRDISEAERGDDQMAEIAEVPIASTSAERR